MAIEDSILFWIVEQYHIGRLEVRLPLGLKNFTKWLIRRNDGLITEISEIESYTIISRFSGFDRFGQRYAKIYAIGHDRPGPNIFYNALENISQSYVLDRLFIHQVQPIINPGLSQHQIFALESIYDLPKQIKK